MSVQVVPANSRLAKVEKALVLLLPMNVWSWEPPGRPNATIGSSIARCETSQLAWNSWYCVRGGSPAAAAPAATRPPVATMAPASSEATEPSTVRSGCITQR